MERKREQHATSLRVLVKKRNENEIGEENSDPKRHPLQLACIEQFLCQALFFSSRMRKLRQIELK